MKEAINTTDDSIDVVQHLLECLARYILTRPLERRRHFLKLYEKRNGKQDTEKLKKIIKIEFDEKIRRRTQA